MSLIIKNQANNWAYVLILVVITFGVGGYIAYYSAQTVKEMNSLSSPDRYVQDINSFTEN